MWTRRRATGTDRRSTVFVFPLRTLRRTALRRTVSPKWLQKPRATVQRVPLTSWISPIQLKPPRATDNSPKPRRPTTEWCCRRCSSATVECTSTDTRWQPDRRRSQSVPWSRRVRGTTRDTGKRQLDQPNPSLAADNWRRPFVRDCEMDSTLPASFEQSGRDQCQAPRATVARPRRRILDLKLFIY